MYSIFAMQAVVTAAVFHAAVAQVPFQLVCPERGFRENQVNNVECTVRGSDVKGASCAVAVSSIILETVDAGVAKSIAHSPFPTCDNNWSSVNNDNGRCANKDTNTDVYTYQFNVTANRAILTNLTGLRCFAECSGGPGVGNPFTYNTSRSCGPPVIFAEQTTALPTTSGSVQPTSSTSPPGTNTPSTGGLSTGEKVGIGVGVPIGGLACAGAVTAIVVYATMISVYFKIAEEKVPTLKEKIKGMKGVKIREMNKKDQEQYKKMSKPSKDPKDTKTEESKNVMEISRQSRDPKETKEKVWYGVIEISRRSGNPKETKEKLKTVIKELGGELPVDNPPA